MKYPKSKMSRLGRFSHKNPTMMKLSMIGAFEMEDY